MWRWLRRQAANGDTELQLTSHEWTTSNGSKSKYLVVYKIAYTGHFAGFLRAQLDEIQLWQCAIRRNRICLGDACASVGCRYMNYVCILREILIEFVLCVAWLAYPLLWMRAMLKCVHHSHAIAVAYATAMWCNGQKSILISRAFKCAASDRQCAALRQPKIEYSPKTKCIVGGFRKSGHATLSEAAPPHSIDTCVMRTI